MSKQWLGSQPAPPRKGSWFIYKFRRNYHIPKKWILLISTQNKVCLEEMGGLFTSTTHSENTEAISFLNRMSAPMTTANKWVLIGGGPSPVLSGRRVAQRGDLLFRRLLSAGQGPAMKTPHSGVTLSLAANDTHKCCSGDINRGLLLPSLLRDLSVFFSGLFQRA